jgi:hypothetical protein
MIVFFTNILTCVIILLITMVLNGDLGSRKIPFYGVMKHQRFLQQPYSLLYFFVATVFFKGIANSINGLLVFLFFVGIQLVGIILIYTKIHRKNFLDWGTYINRLKQISVKILAKKVNPKTPQLTIPDICYFLQNLIFPFVFTLSNAYLMVKLLIK